MKLVLKELQIQLCTEHPCRDYPGILPTLSVQVPTPPSVPCFFQAGADCVLALEFVITGSNLQDLRCHI